MNKHRDYEVHVILSNKSPQSVKYHLKEPERRDVRARDVFGNSG